MKRFGKLAAGALLVAGAAIGATLATTAPAAADVTVGVGIGIPGVEYYGPSPDYVNPCAYPRYRYFHPDYCYGYGPTYYGYYDQRYHGPGYYEPAIGGFWFHDSFGHRRWRGGEFHGGGFHDHDWHGDHDGWHDRDDHH